MATIDEALAKLQKSAFRKKFHLSEKDKAYIREKGMDTMRKHATNFIEKRLAPADIPNDGKQTPMRGHPAFVAQHVCACCCRECMKKWYHVPQGRELTESEQARIIKLLMAWIELQITDSKEGKMNKATTNTKLRQIYVLKILYDHTDENHFMTIAQILKILKDEYGMDSYRKTIKEDLDLLINAGFDIEFIKSSQNQYHIISRDFDVAELKVLIDAVVSSKFISKTKSQTLADKLSKLAGPYVAKELVRNIDVERRVKSENKQLLLIVDTINTAINEKKKIAFRYFSYDVRKDKKEKHNGYVYKFSPYKLVWNGDYYYVVGFSDKYNGIGSFRVDRISKTPEILEGEAVPIPKSFDIGTYLNTMFRMYSGEHKEVELVCDNSIMDSIIDRFGEGVKVYANDMESFRIIVNVTVSHVFYSWVFGFGGKVKIKAPADVKEEYLNMLRNACESIEPNRRKK